MKYNDTLASAYGDFSGLTGTAPLPEKPTPSSGDYSNGSFSRVFVKKINDSLLTEINGDRSQNINHNLYQIIYITWAISGPRITKQVNDVTIHGVSNQNLFEIDRVLKEQGVDLKKVLSNPLEYWRGY